jgi:RecA-family ATPase
MGRFLRGRRVVALQDKDEAGANHVAVVLKAVDGVAASSAALLLPDLPPRGDVSDWLNAGGTVAALVEQAEAALLGEVPEAETLPLADLAAWDGTMPTPKTFIMAGLVPARELTLLTGAGGSNKSTFGQQLATCSAAGVPMLGVDVAQGAALYITAEDDEDRLHWMQEHICKALELRMVDLVGKLHLASIRGRLGNEIATYDHNGKLCPSPAFTILRATIIATQARLVVLDNSAHLFAGNENDRGQVTAFVNLLYSLCTELGVTLILIAHTNKAGDSWSGSTAWLNAVRSQIVLERPENSDDPDARVLKLGKANYARQGEELAFRWHEFALVRDEDLSPSLRAELAATAAATAGNTRFMELLDKATAEKRAVSASRAARNYAPRIFAGMTGAKGMKEKAFEGALERLLHLREIVAEGNVYKRGNRVWVTGIARAESAPTAAPTMHKPSAPTRTNQHLQPAPSTHTYTTYNGRGPSGSAAPDTHEYFSGDREPEF